MDTINQEKSTLVYHRVRKYSTQSIPIQAVRGSPASDGIGSPTDHAYQPPGVVTKIESIQTKKPPSPKIMICTNCRQKVNCSCKKCTLEKLGIYSRRENMFLAVSQRKQLQQKVVEAIETSVKIKNEITKHEEKVLQLRKLVKNRRMRIEQKRHEIAEVGGKLHIQPSQFAAIFEKHKSVVENNEKKKEVAAGELDKREKNLAEIRRFYCRSACFLFPVKEVDVQIENVVSTSKNSKNWAIVNENIEEGRRFTIRGAYTNDKLRNRLASKLSQGIISLPSELHPPLAAFTNTIQLVHFFNVVFNFYPPVQLNHQDICIRERWSKELFAADWETLCDSIVYLCAFTGINPATLIYSNPHFNLMEFAQFVVHGNGNIQKIGSRPFCDLADVHQMIVNQRPDLNERKDEEDETWFFVD